MAASSSSFQEKYEVFLSFRGEDTRDGFTGHLYNALCKKHINTFKDDENLESGHKISEIMDAIKESKICIIVFSKDFASSTWCLDEVVRILECKRGGNYIIPIFFGVEPSIVRKQEQSYAVSFGKHEQRFTDKMDMVQHWRDALNEVAALSGYDSKNKRYPSTYDHSKRGLIGIENRIEEIEGLLCIDSMDVRTIGLYGMGGIGKTTFSLAVFQKLSHHFESHCFLRNVRGEYEKHGIMELRKQLLSHLFYHDKTIQSLESHHLQERLCRTKVLIVLDDLDDAISQLNELLPKGYRFGAGSRIIVTTRDAQLVKSKTDKVYEVKRLNDVESLKLFCLHAFENNCDLEGYLALSKSAANYADGNPLALEVLGSSLRSKSVEEWKSALDELQTEPNPKIEKVLRISFDQLGKKDKKGFTPIQDVFLDIACFHDNGVDRKFVESITHYSGATKKISDLIDKCLIIEGYNRLSMHSLIRQMGQAIVCDENKEPGNRSRLWKAKDVCNVLERNTGSCKIEGILLDQSKLQKTVKVTRTAFSKMCHLRFLRFYEDEAYHGRALDSKMYLPSKGIKYLSDELRYLHWDLYPSKYLPSKFSPEYLVEIVMRGSQLVELPWNEGQPLGNLKKIDLSYCKGLIQIQKLCAATNLEQINLRGCSRLVQVPSGFENLKKLGYLDLSCCEKLKDGLENLPLNIVWLLLSETAIVALPLEFQRLSNFQDLGLKYCKKLEDIQNISSSMCITELNLDRTAIKTLPKSIWKMRCLKYLSLDGCPNLEKLPEISYDCMSSSLELLKISGSTRLKSIPESIWRSSLKELTLSDCPKLEKLPEISYDCMSSSLELLKISGSTRLKSIPESIWRRSSLKMLTLSDCPNLEKLQEISDDCISSSIEDLVLSGCMRLKSVPESIWKMNSLKRLTLMDCPNLEKLPEILDDCMSSSVQELVIRRCTRLKFNPTQNLCGAISLRRMMMEGCTSLVQVPSWFKNLNQLVHLDLGCCKNLNDGLENLPLNIRVLSLYGTAIEGLPSSFWDLEELEYLDLSHCKNLTDGMENLPLNLQTLFLSGCTRLKSIPVLPSGLNILDASNCTSLETMSSWRDLMSSWRDLQQLEGTTEKCDFQKRQAVYPGNEIPEWFSHQTDDGNSLNIYLPPNWFSIHNPLFEFFFSLVFMLDVSEPYIFLEINFKTNVNSDDRLHGHYPILHTLFCDGGREIYGCLMEHDHVLIANAKLNLRDVFGEEWSSVCGNATEVSFRVSIRGAVVIDWEIKKFGLELVNMWGTASKNKRLFSECSGQPNGYQDEAHDPHINSKRIKAQQIIK
ncbi:disease resistance protein RPV1 isoform X2 [Ziziphus jujuba]|uniref:ADP-ribosyl cyclase/cyclic ADP-ribose hydrolase n=1 Tax=Ziziphus jujuba TaxID=326968 RepID=A0ABM4AB75_ZIZJJ|nr:disease resistance protein RPV1 isoform X2 [Ziziphus jujuba]